MLLTSKDANKLLKRYEEELAAILCEEEHSKTWIASTSENKEDVRPEYDYQNTQNNIDDLNRKIRTIKHAINKFNVSTIVPEFDQTIDELLVYIPQLTAQKRKLAEMKSRPKFERICGNIRSNIIDYTYINYDASKVAADYLTVDEKLTKAQLALDKINITEMFELNI